MKDPAAFPKFRLSLLGRMELAGRDGVIHLPSKKLSGLLAYLACTGKPQSRGKLATLFWGSHYETHARLNLRQALFRLRRILGQDTVLNNDEEVWLASGTIECDVARFKALIADASDTSLAKAIDLYRGPLLADLNIAEDAWSDWCVAEREWLDRTALDAMVHDGLRMLQSGNARTALEVANRAIAMNALREDAHRLMVQGLAATGRKAEALKHYEDLVSLLRRELRTEPDAATQSLIAELRSAKIVDTPRKEGELFAPAHDPSEADLAATVSGGKQPRSQGLSSGLEQRQMTIMVCSMTVSAPSSASLDPEEAHDLVAAFHKLIADHVARFDGFIAHHLSYGATVYFGYPAAHEYDAERAVHAGLAILDAVATLDVPAGSKIAASAGIATGLVVIGQRPGTAARRQPVVTGDTPILAAALQARAAPGKVVVAAGTRQLIGQMFDCRKLGAIEVNGHLPLAEVWQVCGETIGVSRYEARRKAPQSPLVGRQEEMELLLRRWDQAMADTGRVVLISGEPGIGKSRLAESLITKLESEAHECFRFFCSPNHVHSALYPFVAQLQRDANFEQGSDVTASLDKLEAQLKSVTANPAREAALIAELLGMSTDGRYPASTASPREKREMTLGALLSRIEGSAKLGPVLIVFEDIHWIDPTSLDLLERIVTRASQRPLLLLVTSRPHFLPSWIGQSHVMMLSMNRLGPTESAGMIRDIALGKALPEAIVDQVLSHTDGVPLFIEELTYALLESGLLREAEDEHVTEGPLPLAIPTTLQASLLARLDQLGAGKDVAVVGAAIGREFSHELIAAVSTLAPTDLEAALDRLTASGLVSRHGTFPNTSYVFKHALVQDVAYATMVKSRRRQVHASIAEAMIERIQAFAENQPEIIAHHLTEAGLAVAAIDYWVNAGQLAHARWANSEAASFFERALRITETFTETRERLEQAVDLCFALKTSLTPLGQFGRIITCLRKAESLARKLDDRRRLCQFSVHMCQTLSLTGHAKDAAVAGQDALALAESLEDVPLQAEAALFLGTARFSMLDHRSAEHQFLKVLQLLDDELSLEQFSLAGFPAVTANGFLTRIYADQGKFKHGIRHGEEGIRLAEAVDHPYSLAIACWCLADLLTTKGDLKQAVGLLERGLHVAREWNLPFLVAGNSGSLGYVYTLLGRADEGLPLLEQTLDVFEKMGHRLAQSLFLAPLGEAYLLAGRSAGAREFAEQALKLARDSGQRSGEAGALHLLGEIIAETESVGHAESHFRDALTLAGELKMRPLAARCHHGLGKLYLLTNQPDRAHEEFAAAIATYRELDMRFWLEQANAESHQRQ